MGEYSFDFVVSKEKTRKWWFLKITLTHQSNISLDESKVSKRPILGSMFRFEKPLRKYHARVRNKNPQLGFFILSFWTIFFYIYISLMNLILENSFFGVNHFVRLIMIYTNLMFNVTSWLFEITGSCITTWWLSSPKAFSGTWRTSSECKTP